MLAGCGYMEQISIRGARTHNLKNVSVDLPRGKLIVITGLSGSGKSSLAFDTLYAEGQRRYVESLSAYARQFLRLMPHPDVDEIKGLSPAIAIDQRSSSGNPRSTVGTATEISDYLRLLFARAGTPYCSTHDLPLRAEPIAAIVDKTLKLSEGSRVMILAPVAQQPKLMPQAFFEQMLMKGFSRCRIDDEIVQFESAGEAAACAEAPHRVAVVVDRVRVRAEIRERLADSFQTAADLAGGRVLVLGMDDETELAFSTKYACPICDYSVGALEPRMFTPNSAQGCCPRCRGTGAAMDFDPKKIVHFPALSVRRGAVEGWDARNERRFARIKNVLDALGADADAPWESLPESVRSAVLFGSNETRALAPPFAGVVAEMRDFWKSSSDALKLVLERFRSTVRCPDCGGSGLCEAARCVYVGEGAERRSIDQLSNLSIDDLRAYFERLSLAGESSVAAERLIHEISARLALLSELGLGYLTLGRKADSLSGGESQRIRLAGQIGSSLAGVMYVLDEPSIGLHQRDNNRLIRTMERLRDLGNTVVVVEHDEDVVRAADFIVDMGPGAGEHGGEVVACGTPEEVAACAASLTGAYLKRKKEKTLRSDFDPASHKEWFTLAGARGRNLKNADLRFPAGKLTVVSGVSGSGKSSLVNDTLYPVLAAAYHRAKAEALPFERIDGIELFDKVVAVDQSPIGRTPRSNVATYAGIFGAVREIFARTQMSRERGYDAKRFSFNSKGGRCEACEGDGVVKVEMQFLPDAYVTCEVCGGKRYNRETLEVRYKGLDIAEVLNLTADDAVEVFDAYPVLKRRLEALQKVGLGYIRLGQRATTLSGG